MESKVFIGKRTDGRLVAHTSLEAMKEIDGVTKVLKEVTLEEFEKAGSLVREINGKIVLGETEKEIAEGKKQEQINDYKGQLEVIDLEAGAGRKIRKVALDIGVLAGALRDVAMDFAEVANILHKQFPDLAEFDPEKNPALKLIVEFDPSENYDLQNIAELENKAIAIREKLSPLLGTAEAA